MLIPLTGFPETIRDSFIILLGFLIAIFGFSRNSVGSYSHGKEESLGAKPEAEKAVSSEEMVNVPPKKRHPRRNFIKPSQEKIDSEVLSSEPKIEAEKSDLPF